MVVRRLRTNKNDNVFWPKAGIFAGGIHATLVGVLLSIRELYYHFIGLELPRPRLYGDMAAWFLIVIGMWLIWSSLKMPKVMELWIIPVGSAIGRLVYFLMALIGWVIGTTHIIYLYLSFTDVFFALVQLWAVIKMKTLMKEPTTQPKNADLQKNATRMELALSPN